MSNRSSGAGRRITIAALSALVLVCAGGSILYQFYVTRYVYLVAYRAGGVGQARVQYQVDSGPFDTALVEQTVELPWELTVRRDWLLHRRSALLQISSESDDMLTCEVLINGISAERRSASQSIGCGYDEERNPIPHAQAPRARSQ